MKRTLHLCAAFLMGIFLLSFFQNGYAQIRAIPLPSSQLGYPGENLSYTMGVGDFNGDGTLDFITRVWVDEVTEGQADNDFKTISYAYLNDGTFLWEFHHNLCPNDIGGDPCWTVTLSVYDFDGNGRDEVITQVKENGVIKLVMLDGMTGVVKKSTVLGNPRPRMNTQATVAHLNGWNNPPYLVYTYGDRHYKMRTIAFDNNLNEYWRFDASKYAPLANWSKPFSWCNIYTCDLDFDQRDEIINGPLLIDDDGSLYLDGTQWYRPHIGASERSYIADIDPNNPGLEWFLIRVGKDPADQYYVQPNYWKGPYLIDVDQKRIIWHHNTHEQGLGWGRLHHGWVGEIEENIPGLECWAKGNYFEGTEWDDILAGKYGDPPNPNSVHIPGYSEKWILYAADGTIIKKKVGYYVGNPVYWDDDVSAEYYHYRSGTLYAKFDGPKLKKNFPRSYGNGECTQADIMGDWREELLFASKYTLYLYGNTSPTQYPNRPSLRTDHNYRMNLASIATGLPKVIMRDFDLNPNPPVLNISKLAFVTPIRSVVANSVSSVITIQTQSSIGIPVNVSENTLIQLSSSSPTGEFSLVANPFVPVDSVVIPKGYNLVDVYYRDSTSGNYQIHASEDPDQGWINATQAISVIGQPVPPVISEFTPTHGQVGSSVTINGDHFAGVTSVTFNGVAALQFNIVSDQEVTATVPPGASTGPIIITNAAGADTSESDFTVDPGAAFALRINCGGPAYTDHAGNQWAADKPFSDGSYGYVGGRTYRIARSIANTDDDKLFQSEHFSMKYYRFTVPTPGIYQVKLLFAEIFYRDANRRLFDVIIEGNRVLDDFDIFSVVGADFALERMYEINVTDNILDVAFVRVKDSPKIAAIEITGGGVNPPVEQIDRLVIITPARTVFTDSVTEVITVQTQSSLGNAINVDQNTTLYFSSTSGSGEFSLTQNPFIPATEGILAAGTNQMQIYYRDASTGTPTIEIGENPDQGWQNATQTVTVLQPAGPPSISDFSPTQGTVGTQVTINGANFVGVSHVRFNGTDASNFNVVSENQIIAVVPANATTGKIEVVTPAGSVQSANDFVIEQAPAGEYLVRVNCGGGEYTGTDGRQWQADQPFQAGSWGYTGGRTFHTVHNIKNTNDDPLFQTEHYSMRDYKFTVPEAGWYHVTLLFAEIYYNAPNKRKFSVALERNIVLNNFDIFAEAGHDAALSKEFDVYISDGILEVKTFRILDSPKFSAIEVKKKGLDKKIAGKDRQNYQQNEVPERFSLSQNYPNPFNPGTEFRMSVPRTAHVKVVIYNQLGQAIRTLWNGSTAAGNYSLRWDGCDDRGNPVGNGIYLYQMKTDRFIATKKMILLR